MYNYNVVEFLIKVVADLDLLVEGTNGGSGCYCCSIVGTFEVFGVYSEVLIFNLNLFI